MYSFTYKKAVDVWIMEENFQDGSLSTFQLGTADVLLLSIKLDVSSSCWICHSA